MLVLLVAPFAPLCCLLLGERDVEEAEIPVHDALRMQMSHLSWRQNRMTR